MHRYQHRWSSYDEWKCVEWAGERESKKKNELKRRKKNKAWVSYITQSQIRFARLFHFISMKLIFQCKPFARVNTFFLIDCQLKCVCAWWCLERSRLRILKWAKIREMTGLFWHDLGKISDRNWFFFHCGMIGITWVHLHFLSCLTARITNIRKLTK